MVSAEAFARRRRKLAQRFLQTAVVVDDEAYMDLDRSDAPNEQVVVPGRRAPTASREDSSVGRRSEHTLNAQSVIDAFSTLGVICGVVGPTESAMESMRIADIVVLDWLLQEGDSRYALRLLRELLAGELDRNSLRLVAIYTGEARLDEIYSAVFADLTEAGLHPSEIEPTTAIAYRHGRVVLYAKSDVNLAETLRQRSVAEADLPERLVDDFASMTQGLLPGIALTSLTAVRESAHKLLDRFGADLDPAFLAHRACLSNPEDAERQIVSHVAEELRGLMENAVAEESPAGADAVESWIRRKSDGVTSFVFDNRRLDLEATIRLANGGLVESELKNNAFEGLSAGFAGDNVAGIDERLAWIMSSRTVFNAPPPTLWLGSVVTAIGDGSEKPLICIRPRCDCVRLDKETAFIFLPRVNPRKVKEQLVVRLGDEFKRLGIGMDPGGWVLLRFNPSVGNRSVVATKREADGGFEFTDAGGKCYMWQGELKAEYTHRVAQNFAMTLSRVAVDESEWLRRMAGKGL